MRRQWLALGSWLLAGLLAGAAHADEVETREYRIQVDDREAGTAQMRITRRADGSEVVVSQVEVRVGFLISYTYRFEGTEVWREGRLVALTARCQDGSQRFQVQGTATPEGLRVQVNGRSYVTRHPVWTTSFWKWLDPQPAARPVWLLDVDRGEEQARQLHYLGREELTGAGRTLTCAHLRIVGGPEPLDLWFDEQHLLVQEVFVDSGHRTVVQLSKVRR